MTTDNHLPTSSISSIRRLSQVPAVSLATGLSRYVMKSSAKFVFLSDAACLAEAPASVAVLLILESENVSGNVTS